MAETISIGGTGAGIGTARVLAAEFAKAVPGISVVVVPNLGGSGGVKALAAGALDVSILTRPVSPEEAAQGLVAAEYGKTPFVFATAKKNPGGFKNFDEIAEVYTGRRTTWGDGEPMRLVMRPKNDSDTVLLESVSPVMKHAIQVSLARPGMVLAVTDQESADAIEKIPGAIGSLTLALIQTEKRPLQVIAINGIVPSPKAVADGTYPYYKTMYLLRKTGGKEAAVRFFEFVASPQGQRILANSGHLVAGVPTDR